MISLASCKDARAVTLHQHLTVMSLELHCTTRQKLTPDPEYDSIAAIFYVVTNDVPEDNPAEKAAKIEGKKMSRKKVHASSKGKLRFC